jgi:hypothetical protein
VNNFVLLEIEAKPLQSRQQNQSHCQADGYIFSFAPGFLQTQFFLNRGRCKSKSSAAAERSRCRDLNVSQHRSDLMVTCTTLTTSAGNLIGDNSIMAGAHGGSTLLEKGMKTIGKIVTASAVAFSAFAFTATPGSADTWSPATVPPGHYCLSYDGGGTDCSFISYGQCEAMASGQDAECYGNTPADNVDPWGTRRQRRPF